jgi:hypothetical protein
MLLFAAITAAGSLWVAHRNPFVRGGDAAGYCLAARYSPLRDQFDGPTQGWGYPLAIKALSVVTGDEFRTGQAISVVCAAIYMAFAALFCFRTLPRPLAWCACAVIAVHPVVLEAGGSAMTEMLFLALLYASLCLCFEDQAGVVSCGLAGIGVLLAMDVRGNGAAAVLVIPLLLLRRPAGGWKQAAAFTAGAFGTWIGQAAVFTAMGIPEPQWSRGGAGEIAFAVLDKSDNSGHNLIWNAAYTSYLTLLSQHGGEVLRAAAVSLYHIHDWMLLPQFQVLGFFVIPGLFLWFRRASNDFTGAALCLLAVLATFTWHFHFLEGRYLLAAMPLLVAAAVSGFSVVPRHFRLLPGRPKIPLRAPILLLAVGLTVAISARSAIGFPSPRPRDVAQYQAGLWLAQQKPDPSDRMAASRMTVAYYGRVFPVDMRRVFDVDAPFAVGQVAPALRKSNCQWLVWIEGHSQTDHPQLEWLARQESFPGCRLVYRHAGISIWKVQP